MLRHTDVVDSNGDLRIHRRFDSFGNIVENTHYDESGASVTFIDAGFVDLAFAFTGRYLDPVTGLQNNLHRWYDSGTGRWISEDPIGFAAGDTNLNRYVGNEPTGGMDPNGMLECNPSGENCNRWRAKQGAKQYQQPSLRSYDPDKNPFEKKLTPRQEKQLDEIWEMWELSSRLFLTTGEKKRLYQLARKWHVDAFDLRVLDQKERTLLFMTADTIIREDEVALPFLDMVEAINGVGEAVYYGGPNAAENFVNEYTNPFNQPNPTQTPSGGRRRPLHRPIRK